MPKSRRAAPAEKASFIPPFECVALLLQGGGALGAYQAGVYQALSEAGLQPNWVAGISIGAINAAIIAGNAPEHRVDKLRQFWESVTSDEFQYTPQIVKSLMTSSDPERRSLSEMSALRSVLFGIPGFYKSYPFQPFTKPVGSKEAISFADTSPLRGTLESLIDFDRLNDDSIYFKIGAVNVASGDLTEFDNKNMQIGPEHIMASGALPPGFPPVEVDGEFYWDGGLISNTPLQWVFDSKTYQDTLIFQVDLWSAEGEFPQNIAEAMTRMKDIQYSSRTRANTDAFRDHHKLRHAISTLLEQMPPKLAKLPEMNVLRANADSKVYNIVHLIYHNKIYEGYTKDVEFSRLSMEAHWDEGYRATLRTLSHKQVLQRPTNKEGIAVFDFSRDATDEATGRKRMGQSS